MHTYRTMPKHTFKADYRKPLVDIVHPPNTFKRFSTHLQQSTGHTIDRSHTKSPIVRRAPATTTRIKQTTKRAFESSDSDSEDVDMPSKRQMTDWPQQVPLTRKRTRDDEEDGEDAYKRLHADPDVDLLPNQLQHVHIDDALPPILEEDVYSIVDLDTGETLSPVPAEPTLGAIVPYNKRPAFTVRREPRLDDLFGIPDVIKRDAIYGPRAGWQMVLYEPPPEWQDMAKEETVYSGYIRELDDEEELADAVAPVEEEEDVANQLAMMDLD